MIKKRLTEMWDSNEAKRGSRLNANSALMKMLTWRKFTYRLGVQFLVGQLPFRSHADCTLCEKPYDSLMHLELKCNNNTMNISEESSFCLGI